MRTALLSLLLVTSAAAQPTDLDWAGPSSLEVVIDTALEADVVYLGEIHDDSVAHVAQLAILEAVLAQADRPVALGLEMFETDVQLVLDEYLAGHIQERDLQAVARPWGNYATDYRPMVEAAKLSGAPVLATNAPARYVRRLARGETLSGLEDDALATLPPLPIAPVSRATEAAFRELMGGMAGHGGPSVDDMLAAQNLRDVSMAHVVATWLAQNPGGLVVHVNGSFHSAGGRGIPEHLERRMPGVRQLVVTLQPDDAAADAGDDFVVRTGQ
ncbi:ChaN family lipoprotein [Rubrivirga sp.]|uniref:ChaN family lipoprotein n=1 Tax=Rubrivirga sp. TaxID=1885344 RepID=UPI003C763B95